MEQITWSEIERLIWLGAFIVALFLAHKSVPPKQVDELLKLAKDMSVKTPSNLDDRLIELAELIRAQWTPTTVTSTDPVTGVTTTHDVELVVDMTKPSLEQIANEAYADGTNMTAQWLDDISAINKK